MKKNVYLLRLWISSVGGADFCVKKSIVHHQPFHVLFRGFELGAGEQLTEIELRRIDQLRGGGSVLGDAIYEDAVHEKIFVGHEDERDLAVLVLFSLHLNIVEAA